MSVEGLLFGLFFVGVGIFAICGAACDWDWFMESRKARFFVAMLGRNGARLFYGFLGIVVITLGLGMAIGLVSTERKRQRFRLGHATPAEAKGDRSILSLTHCRSRTIDIAAVPGESFEGAIGPPLSPGYGSCGVMNT